MIIPPPRVRIHDALSTLIAVVITVGFASVIIIATIWIWSNV